MAGRGFDCLCASADGCLKARLGLQLGMRMVMNAICLLAGEEKDEGRILVFLSAASVCRPPDAVGDWRGGEERMNEYLYSVTALSTFHFASDAPAARANLFTLARRADINTATAS